MIEFTAILLMAGVGSRFEGEKPKQFLRLSGKKIYLHTLEHFLSSGLFDEILLVVHPKYISEVEEDIARYEKVRLIAGGKTRKESSHIGIKAARGEFVVIHDAVRPFVSKRILQENCRLVKECGATDTCISSADTIVCAKVNRISDIPKREDYLRGQTPQSFKRELILKAHENEAEVTDDCALVHALGHPIAIVEGSEENIKITTSLDLFLAEQLMRCRSTALSPRAAVSGKVFAVVGGSGGIGSAIVKALEKEGAKALVLSRSSSYKFDVRSQENMREIFAQIGPIDGLINSAGLLMTKTVFQLKPEEIQELLEVNLHGVIYTCRSALLREGGHIINIASSSFVRGREKIAIYSAAKAAVINFTQALAEECPHLQINALVPQRTATKMRAQNFPGEDPKTLLTPEEVAQAALSLLSTPNVTGQIIEVRI